MRHIPNILTSLRVLLVFPLIVALIYGQFGWALVCFATAGLTDILDGFLARHFNWESHFGAFLDPMADKLLLVSSFLMLTCLQVLPIWVFILITARDIYISVGALAYLWVLGKFRVTPHWTGKINAFTQTLLILSILVHLSLGWLTNTVILILIYSAAIVCFASIVQYTWIWGRRAQLALREQ